MTHVFRINALSDIYVGGDGRTFFRKFLGFLNGSTDYAAVLFKLPRAGQSGEFSRKEIDEAQQNYLQAAGSRDSMTIEQRVHDKTSPVQYVVGRMSEPGNNVEILIGENSTVVKPSEVFSINEAVEIFDHYYTVGAIPEKYSLREIKV